MEKNINPSGPLYEEDLYNPVRDYLTGLGYKVNGEVRSCDMTAVKNGELIIVELKKNFSIELLMQAVKRQKVADSVYVAIPKPKKLLYTKKWQDVCLLLKRLELGLILVTIYRGKSLVEVVLHPSPYDLNKSKKRNKKKRSLIISEINSRSGDYNKGGSRGKKLVTAYRESTIFIACCIKNHGQLTVRKLKALGSDPKKNLLHTF